MSAKYSSIQKGINKKWVLIGKMSESEEIKTKCETLAETGLGSCGDRVGLTFVQMQLALNLSDKEVTYMNLQEV